MKNRLLLVFVFLLSASFSFAQKHMPVKKDMKKATLKAVQYLNDNGVKFTDKQEAACFSAFSEYARNMVKVSEKAALRNAKSGDNKKDKLSEIESRKYINSHAMRFQKKRDDSVKQLLKKKQVEKYEKLVSDIHPLTLEVDKKSKKGKK